MPTAEERAAETRAQKAQHEAGHAAASWAQGIAFTYVTLNDPDGIPLTVPRPFGEVPTTPGQRFLIALCGGIADQQRRGLTMRGSQIVKLLFGGGTDALFEVDDPATGQVKRISRVPAVGPGGCLRPLALALPTMMNGRAECVRMWRDAERFAQSCRPAIDALAAALLAYGELSYDEAAKIAEDAMGDKPAPEIPWRAPRPGASPSC